MIDAFAVAFRAVLNRRGPVAGEQRRPPRPHSGWLPDTITQRPCRNANWPCEEKSS
jgi:hypothetical protein